ncbi:unnamed protein product [Heterobilharzia americana]|nr:unnamed protein product [Heterobilharzia americana]
MRIGSDHQSEIQCLLKSKSEDTRLAEIHEELVWSPSHSLTDQEIDMFCVLARAVGTYGRAHDTSSSARQPLLLSAAAAAGRDITRQHAHDILHEANYDLNKAINLLLPGGQPVIYRDQLEDWSANEAHIFEEALDKYPRFSQIYSVLYHGTDKVSRPCEGCGFLNSTQWYAWGSSNSNSRLCSGCWSYWKRYGGLKNIDSKERPTTTLRVQHINNNPVMETDSRSGGPINITGSVNHQFKSHSIGLPIGMNDTPDSDIGISSADHNISGTMLNNGNVTTGNSGKSVDGSGFFSTLVGTPRGTQCFRTPLIIRLARILCPDLVQPQRLARHPGGIPEIFSSKQQQLLLLSQDENECTEPNVTGIDNLSERNMLLMYTALKTAAQPIIAQLPDPSLLLTRSRKTLRLNDVVDAMASRKGIILQTLDLSLTLNFPLPNGPVHSRKRPHSPAPINSPFPRNQIKQTIK